MNMQLMNCVMMMSSFVITETVCHKVGYVMVIMTVETTVMKTNVVCVFHMYALTRYFKSLFSTHLIGQKSCDMQSMTSI